MFPSTQIHTLDCHCIKCHNSHQKSSYATKRTEARHNKRARVEAAMRNMDVDTEVIPTSRSNSVEAMDGQANSPFLDAASMFDNDRNDNDFDDNVEDEVNEIEIEDFNSEDPFAAPDMPKNEVHQFIAIFTVLFASRHVADKSAAVLIEFINNLLRIYDQDFQLPTSLASLQKMTGFSAITKGIKKFVVCQGCHTVYHNIVSALPRCVSSKLGARSACNCNLMKSISSGALVAKREYVYQSIKNTLSVFFCRPSFEAKIRQWNKELKMPFDGVTHSSGAIYLAINNLLRDERFKPENIILVGLMPGPKEPKTNEINSYLEPLVDDLKQLYVGMQIPTHEFPNGISVHANLKLRLIRFLKVYGF
ncbi:hypothetical protein PHYBLDRAFT_68752 [Phycomyces blakesleeanus NRRL 1555(-)]|uniref:Uncharacterized protein n=1 Tax=Phycomyces blakesleeanus (strain ATCC 8743b / DSM 1359 / FGSC 10004 / NBRC 33097 / NRRL 1555) TaxID=763407 RepID=A0A162TY88_PHYB8|nr:hypothetical protein PHYBLDRAFT_68752 [Phycomyces blakesleeanus NRRL 1555(-)]OAD71962.1 hypothetical protein PHYBLDRAFT_68752 [Phycomyces blakesleeanus NRRL 1555(-)]|eukprot:XP_018290002.1 hypothetical protein PHYBLDRAFT_68752 [Phycomyces blakesleeanus NRRL 1555(-)]